MDSRTDSCTDSCTDSRMNDDCQTIYRNLLKARGFVDVSPAYVRELEETARCDGVCRDLSSLRHAYRKHMGPETFRNVMRYAERAVDERRTSQTLMHFQDRTDSELVAGLDWWNKAWFYTYLRGDKTLATIGIVTSAFAGWRAIQHASRSWKKADGVRCGRRYD